MGKIKVYYFTQYDIKTDKVIRSKRPATLDFITTYHLTPINEEILEVEFSDLDGNGFYTPKSEGG